MDSKIVDKISSIIENRLFKYDLDSESTFQNIINLFESERSCDYAKENQSLIYVGDVALYLIIFITNKYITLNLWDFKKYWMKTDVRHFENIFSRFNKGKETTLLHKFSVIFDVCDLIVRYWGSSMRTVDFNEIQLKYRNVVLKNFDSIVELQKFWPHVNEEATNLSDIVTSKCKGSSVNFV